MKKNIYVDKEGFIDLNLFKEFVDVSKVKFYTLKTNKDKTLHLKFYDKNKKLIKIAKS